jgi:hypothetical protein
LDRVNPRSDRAKNLALSADSALSAVGPWGCPNPSKSVKVCVLSDDYLTLSPTVQRRTIWIDSRRVKCLCNEEGVMSVLRQIQDNLHAVVASLWSSLTMMGHRGETLEDLERNGEALVESSASFVRQV